MIKDSRIDMALWSSYSIFIQKQFQVYFNILAPSLMSGNPDRHFVRY